MADESDIMSDAGSVSSTCGDPTASAGQYMDSYKSVLAEFFGGAGGARSADFEGFKERAARFAKAVHSKLVRTPDTEDDPVSASQVAPSVWAHVICAMHAAKNPALAARAWEKHEQLAVFYDKGLLPRTPVAAARSEEAELDAALARQAALEEEQGPPPPEEEQGARAAKRARPLDLDDFDADEEAPAAAQRPATKNLTVSEVLKSRGLLGPEDLLRRAESLAAAAFFRERGSWPQRAAFFTHSFVTYEYEPGPESQAFLRQCIARALELLAQKSIETGCWATLFSAPPTGPAAQPAAPAAQPAAQPPAQPAPAQPAPQWQPRPAQQPQQQWQPPQQQWQPQQQQQWQPQQQQWQQQRPVAPQWQQQPQQQPQQPPRPQGPGAYAPGFAMPGAAAPGAPAEVVHGSEIQNRVFWKGVLEEMGTAAAVANACYARMGAGANVAQAVEAEVNQLRLDCGKEMPRRAAPRTRDHNGFNVYTTDDLEDMRAVAMRLAAARGLAL
jgi:hypothetical protein